MSICSVMCQVCSFMGLFSFECIELNWHFAATFFTTDRQYSTWPSSSGSAVVPCRAAGARRSRCQVMCVEQESQLSQISAGCALCCVLCVLDTLSLNWECLLCFFSHISIRLDYILNCASTGKLMFHVHFTIRIWRELECLWMNDNPWLE